MTAKHKNQGGIPIENGPPDDEKLFDFDKGFNENDSQSTVDGEDTNEKIAGLEKTISELKEKNLRLLAEFDNYKKRTSKERYELMNSASKDVIIAFLPVLDDFERAIKTDDETHAGSLKEGVRMIYNRLLNVMQSQGIKAMESDGETFDPDLHDAITEVSVQDPSQVGKVIDTIEKGYLLNDKIIRHAKVVVGK